MPPPDDVSHRKDLTFPRSPFHALLLICCQQCMAVRSQYDSLSQRMDGVEERSAAAQQHSQSPPASAAAHASNAGGGGEGGANTVDANKSVSQQEVSPATGGVHEDGSNPTVVTPCTAATTQLEGATTPLSHTEIIHSTNLLS